MYEESISIGTIDDMKDIEDYIKCVEEFMDTLNKIEYEAINKR